MYDADLEIIYEMLIHDMIPSGGAVVKAKEIMVFCDTSKTQQIEIKSKFMVINDRFATTKNIYSASKNLQKFAGICVGFRVL